MKKQETIDKLYVFDNPEIWIPKTSVLPGPDRVHEMILLEIEKPANGSYLMKIKDVAVTDNGRLTPDQMFEAWMVMGHTLKHLLSDYKKELIEYMVKEYRTREQLEKEQASERK
jgi:hypothetical protein